MYLVLTIWLTSIFIATAASSLYVRYTGKSDAIYAMYVIYLALSQIIAARLVFLDLGIQTFVVPAAVLIFPFTYQLTDMVNEYFGRNETHKMIFIAFITQVLMAFFVWMATIMPIIPSKQYLDAPWKEIFGLSIRITAASWISYLITENLDAIIFAKIRELTGKKHLWIRSVLSDAPMLALDSLIFVTLAFYGVVPFNIYISIIIGQIATKWFSGIVDTPFIYLERFIVESKLETLDRVISIIVGEVKPKLIEYH